jgi:hypothetical protein
MGQQNTMRDSEVDPFDIKRTLFRLLAKLQDLRIQ